MKTGSVTRAKPALRKPLFLAIASACMALAGQAPALASISLDPEAIINFDFKNPPQSPLPPYTFLRLEFDFDDATGPFTLYLYDGLDGTGTKSQLFTSIDPPQDPFLFGSSNPSVVDGIFSVGLLSSARTFNSARATGVFCGPECQDPEVEAPPISTRSIQGTLSTSAIPEPSVLALMGIAVAGLAATRRKRRT